MERAKGAEHIAASIDRSDAAIAETEEAIRKLQDQMNEVKLPSVSQSATHRQYLASFYRICTRDT